MNQLLCPKQNKLSCVAVITAKLTMALLLFTVVLGCATFSGTESALKHIQAAFKDSATEPATAPQPHLEAVVKATEPAGTNVARRLYTRIYHIHMPTVSENLEAFAATNTSGAYLPKSSSASNARELPPYYVPKQSSAGINPASPNMNFNRQRYSTRKSTLAHMNSLLLSYLGNSGILLNPPQAIFLNTETGQIMAHGTKDNLDALLAAIERLNSSTVELTFSFQFLSFDNSLERDVNLKGFFEERGGKYSMLPLSPLLSGLFRTNTGLVYNDELQPTRGHVPRTNAFRYTFSTAKLTPQDRDSLLESVSLLPGVTIENLASVTTLSGRQAHISRLDSVTVVDQAREEDGKRVYDTGSLWCGPQLDIHGKIGKKEVQAKVKYVFSLANFFGYESKIPPTPLIGHLQAQFDGEHKPGEIVAFDLLPQPKLPQHVNERYIVLVTFHGMTSK